MDEDILIYSYGSDIYLNLYTHDCTCQFEVFDMNGRCVCKQHYAYEAFQKIHLDVHTGFYIVHVVLPERVIDEKIFLESDNEIHYL